MEYFFRDTVSLEMAYPGDEIPTQYFDCRYTCLRMPLGFERGSEHLSDDGEAIHAWWQEDTEDGRVVAVGRIHLIPDESDGSQSDHAGPGAAICPAFTPLISDGGSLRPAVQIRQMGTREDSRRHGLAAALVVALENAAMRHWGANTGWLQARTGAIEFYQSEDWVTFGDVYDVAGIGPHQSMWKTLELKNIFQEYEESGLKARVEEGMARLVEEGELFYRGTFVTTYSEDGETSGEWEVRISEDGEEE